MQFSLLLALHPLLPNRGGQQVVAFQSASLVIGCCKEGGSYVLMYRLMCWTCVFVACRRNLVGLLTTGMLKCQCKEGGLSHGAWAVWRR